MSKKNSILSIIFIVVNLLFIVGCGKENSTVVIQQTQTTLVSEEDTIYTTDETKTKAETTIEQDLNQISNENEVTIRMVGDVLLHD